MALKWFELVGIDDPPPPRCVLLAEDALILSLRKAAFHDIRHVLSANVFASFLKVYTNRAAYNAADRQELPDKLPVGALGGSKDDALVVKVSMRWTTTNFDASSQPFVDDDSQLSTWKLDAAAIAGFGVRCPSDKLVLFRRPDAIKVFNFLRDDVIRDGRCGYILGPPGLGSQQLRRHLLWRWLALDGWSRGFISGAWLLQNVCA